MLITDFIQIRLSVIDITDVSDFHRYSEFTAAGVFLSVRPVDFRDQIQLAMLGIKEVINAFPGIQIAGPEVTCHGIVAEGVLQVKCFFVKFIHIVYLLSMTSAL